MPPLLILMAGLPGTGKSALARRLAPALPAALIDKDAVRAALFPPEEIEYSRRQDDLCFEVMLSAAGFLLDKGRSVILDGRTFARRYQVERAAAFARAGGYQLRLIECVCAEDVVRRRLEADARSGAHPARNRSYAMYQQLKSAAEPIALPHLSLDTGQDLEQCVNLALAYLTSPAAG